MSFSDLDARMLVFARAYRDLVEEVSRVALQKANQEKEISDLRKEIEKLKFDFNVSSSSRDKDLPAKE